jgi:hypothetical protein
VSRLDSFDMEVGEEAPSDVGVEALLVDPEEDEDDECESERER